MIPPRRTPTDRTEVTRSTHKKMTSGTPTSDLPSPQVFTIFTLPSYEDAVKSSGEPPTYEQSLSDPRVDHLEQNFTTPLPPNVVVPTYPPNQTSIRPYQQNDCRRKFYRSLCWVIAGAVILLLGYIIYIGIWRNINTQTKT
ncbi:uncharacterized protein LOC124284515 isoform X2 [Haliotis rubra]|uniref:uncharacterized protein LOC124284515 isoform X2 n=1 Tax=Haliotis rubra TaxID=36100 RepID=UPI001EE5EF30|nr:uncharacterized protein LOC124284515 isoform X2 [Haliotis rubra]